MESTFYILQNFLNALSRSIFILDLNGRILLANKAACKFVGVPLLNMQGENVSDIQNLTFKTPFNSILKELGKQHYICCDGMLRKNSGKELFVEYSFNKLKLKNKHYALLVITDVTENIKLHEDLQYRIDFEKLISYATRSLNKTLHIDNAIVDILTRLGTFSKVDRAYIFKHNADDDTFSNTHEWCSKGVKSFMSKLQNISLEEEFPWLYKKLKKFNPITINKTDVLPKSAASFQKEMYRENIASILLMPIYHDKKLFGFMGFDKINNYRTWQTGDIELLQTMSQLIAESYMQMEQLHQEAKYQHAIEGMLVRTLEAINIMISEKDFYTSKHQARVAILAAAIAKKMQLPLQQIVGIYLGGLVHDIGKISIPTDILNAPRKLSYEEYAIIKTHPDAGYKIIKDVPFIWPIANIIMQHHERLNGSGYPNGLKESKISLEAKIVSVADVYESMTSHRPYRPRRTKKEAIEELTTHAGILYDKTIVKHCLQIVNKKSFDFNFDPLNEYLFLSKQK